MTKAFQDIPSVISGSAAILLIAAALLMWIPAAQPERAVSSAATQQSERRLIAAQEQLAAYATSMAKRPVFHQTRLPPVEQAEPVAPEVELTLVGVLDSAETRIALLRLSNSPRLYRLEAGERLGKWMIIEIGKTSIKALTEGGALTEMSIGD